MNTRHPVAGLISALDLHGIERGIRLRFGRRARDGEVEPMAEPEAEAPPDAWAEMLPNTLLPVHRLLLADAAAWQAELPATGRLAPHPRIPGRPQRPRGFAPGRLVREHRWIAPVVILATGVLVAVPLRLLLRERARGSAARPAAAGPRAWGLLASSPLARVV